MSSKKSLLDALIKNNKTGNRILSPAPQNQIF